MSFAIKNFNIKTGNIANIKAIRKIADCHIGGIYNSLSEKVSQDFLQVQGNNAVYKKANSIVDTLTYPFDKMPKEILNNVAEKFNIKSLYNSKMLVNYRQQCETEQTERALRGLLKHGEIFIKNAAGDKTPEEIEKILCNNTCSKPFKGICDDVTDEFYKLFDKNLAPDAAKYNTTHERTINKGVLALITATMMGNDFYNKSIKNGKTEEEAKAEAKSKKTQELLESGQEALSQYFLLGAFSSFTNNSTYGSPILNTALSTLFRITSRLSTGRPLTRMKPPEKIPVKTITMTGFMNAAKNNKPVELEEIKPTETPKENKKHLLSLKNIVLACLTSIGVGFAMRYAKKIPGVDKLKETALNIKPVKTVAGKVSSIKESFKKATIGELWLDEKEIKDFQNTLKRCKLRDVAQYFENKLDNIEFIDGKKYIGEYEKFIKIPLTNIQMSKKELFLIPLAPLRIVKEIAGYPYKLVSAALEGIGLIEKTKKTKLSNEYNLVNTILDFKKQVAKFDGNIRTQEFKQHYAKHIMNNKCNALNAETKSNVNNCDIGKLTALLGLFSSIYFSTTDDYNSTLKQTGDVEKANKDARLRGINKIIRTSVQCVCMRLNDLFKISYQSSLIGVATVTAACTVLTDSVSRLLSGMPFRKMNKEELEQYNKSKKEGILKGYYQALDKLTD